MSPASYRVRAHNTATTSQNKIHDDRVARRLGFAGGLVPGVDVYAYLVHLPAATWGREWLARGTMRARFVHPVYDGDEVTVTMEPAAAAGDAPAADLVLRDPDDRVCAEAHVALPAEPGPAPALTDHPWTPLPATRPPASADSLARADPLGSLEFRYDAAESPAYLASVRESLDVLTTVAHPAWLLRRANYVLAANVELGPWIHVASDVRHLGLVEDGAELSMRGRVAATWEQRGHRFVDLDLVLVTDGRRVVMTVDHRAIYRPRGVAGTDAGAPP